MSETTQEQDVVEAVKAAYLRGAAVQHKLSDASDEQVVTKLQKHASRFDRQAKQRQDMLEAIYADSAK